MKTTLHDLDSAPDEAKPLLEDSRESFGMIPGLHKVMAESPGLLEGYKTLHRFVIEKTAFSPEERTVVWMTVNVRHACHYCVPAHTGIAKSEGIDDAIIDALRGETPLPDPKLEALRDFTLAVVESRGRPTADQVEAFEDAGYGARAALDTVLIVSQKVMSNYVNSMFETPVDKPFEKFAWEPGQADAA